MLLSIKPEATVNGSWLIVRAEGMFAVISSYVVYAAPPDCEHPEGAGLRLTHVCRPAPSTKADTQQVLNKRLIRE